MLQKFYKLKFKAEDHSGAKSCAAADTRWLAADFRNIIWMHVLWPVINISNIRYELFQKHYIWTSLAVFVTVVSQQFVHFKHLFVVKY